MSERKRCQWCKDMVNADECFASQIPFGVGWYCDLCSKPVELGAAEDERNPFQPSSQPK
jgi:hypothetical protein